MWTKTFRSYAPRDLWTTEMSALCLSIMEPGKFTHSRGDLVGQGVNPQPPAFRAVPSKGVTLSSLVEPRAKKLRNAATLLAEDGGSKRDFQIFDDFFIPATQRTFVEVDECATRTRFAWAVLSIWLVCCRATREFVTISNAIEWFCEGEPSLAAALLALSSLREKEATKELNPLGLDELVDDLLPYLLDTNAPGTRLNLIADSSVAPARKARKSKGVFYTPLDLAEVMVARLIASAPSNARQTIIDPACGSGVFLREYVRQRRNKLRVENVSLPSLLDVIHESAFGVDVSLVAIESCAFVLLRDVLSDWSESRIAPFKAWRTIRQNLLVSNALSIRTRSHLQRHDLFEATVPFGTHNGFPHGREGFDLLIGNPPYAELGPSGLRAVSDSFFQSADANSSAAENVCVPFVELVWKLLRPDGAAALVLPLSLAYNRSKAFRKLRRLIQADKASWSFAFFDREPHGLFGEDVKTRNVLAFRSCDLGKDSNCCTIGTTRLIRFTSKSRERVLNSIQFTPLASNDIEAGIPKLEGSRQNAAFQSLARRAASTLGKLPTNIAFAPFREAFSSDDDQLFIGATAYSFIGVYPALNRASVQNQVLSDSKVLRLKFSDENVRSAAFAILSSRVTFWLWLTLSDGFHLPRWFVDELATLSAVYEEDVLTHLAEWGRSLWLEVSEQRVVSVNAGKTTLTFRQYQDHPIKDRIDSAILNAFGIPEEFLWNLKATIQATLAADPYDPTRLRKFSRPMTSL